MSDINITRFLLDLKEDNFICDDNFSADFIILPNGVTAKRIFLKSTTSFIVCPHCGQVLYKLHDYRFIQLKHLFCGQQPLIISIRKKRFHCDTCNTHVTEKLKCVNKNCFISTSVHQSISFSLRSITSLKAIAAQHNVSTSTVYRSLQKVEEIKRPKYLPQVLSFDEFRANTTDGKYAFLVVDPMNKQILEILGDRKFNTVYKYFASFSRKIRNQVKYIISDLWEPYRQIMKKLFPNATMVADKFHYQRVVNTAMNSVRKRICSTLTKKQAYFIKKNWRLLNKNFNNIDDSKRRYSYFLKRTASDFELLNFILSLSSELAEAHSLYQDFLCLISLDNQKHQTQLLEQWIKNVEERDIPEFQSVIKTIKKWKEPICASFGKHNGCKLSNGFIEGTNNKIKVIKRVSFGYRSFRNFRKRILLVFC